MGKLSRIKVDNGGHYLINDKKEPFFWLGDTAWQLFHRLTREEAQEYFRIRSEQGFNVTQIVVLSEFNGISSPNAYGDLPLINKDPSIINEKYFSFIDECIQMAADHSIYVVMLPTWGSNVIPPKGTGPAVFDEINARVFGDILGKRYGIYSNVLWMLGGDREVIHHRPVDTRPIWRAMASGIADAAPDPFITFHVTKGPHSTSLSIHNEPWLSMNTMQSGHGLGRDVAVWEWIDRDYHMLPTKPTLMRNKLRGPSDQSMAGLEP
ncbi:MAG: DUF4038 domain-containing protein, partial [Bacteroidales bacterium]|nr:DUF4038 domain-containing protein [Bacteroidales bacterium]